MLKISNKVNSIEVSATVVMSELAAELKQQGRDVISLSIGEPGFFSPDCVKQAAKRAIDNNITKYPPIDGISELKEAIVKRYKRDYGLSFNKNQICVTSGTKQSIYNIFTCIFDDGDEAIYFAPYWVCYPEQLKLAGAKSVVVKTYAENNFQLDIKEIEKAITSKTKAIILNSPNNPTGVLYTKQTLASFAGLIRNYPDIWIISDEIYDQTLFDDVAISLLQIAPDLSSKFIIASGMSKGYAMAGWRVGYVIAPEILKNAIAKLQSQTTGGACSISQMASIEALALDNKYLERYTSAYKERVMYVYEYLDSMEGVEVVRPSGTFYLFPKIQKLLQKTKFKTDIEFCLALLKDQALAITPGSYFGLESYIRISCADDLNILAEAMTRLSIFIESAINR
ncbi:pyridoxal phosphate-dependent aminotransferase [Francisella philomiragia]|uniref:Aminotransferase n=1 Tax=Francisella philomiragia subsp. philomiragia (strain ATCC 25017 / CCUG 19701 / FSC 153 / O\|nr:pyridoxal phosphate-dependent aminotransferase [Francisella philomiragia]AJI46537.1 aminotransferase class I and II family protein [Francisella philomiragia]AJI49238.1 aminotransferase class I and II family protein [Francisella philomiragia]MBK2019645.1 pyridoxal phosphate-dependent aminotransferase [Francisella philomiragia]MBK2031116.1 pyridoxal phosphate-dependent aminotransferase [Francisella philomiragia]MBK2264644.1 pyridoxal phosphate-dependent aminotransferase [Francisella philomira